MVFVILISGPFRSPTLITRTIVSLIEPLKGILFVLFWGSFSSQENPEIDYIPNLPTSRSPPLPPRPASLAGKLLVATTLSAPEPTSRLEDALLSPCCPVRYHEKPFFSSPSRLT